MKRLSNRRLFAMYLVVAVISFIVWNALLPTLDGVVVFLLAIAILAVFTFADGYSAST